LPAERSNLSRDVFRGSGVDAFALEAATRIVHDDLGAPRGKQQRIAAPQPAAATGDDRDSTVESEL